MSLSPSLLLHPVVSVDLYSAVVVIAKSTEHESIPSPLRKPGGGWSGQKRRGEEKRTQGGKLVGGSEKAKGLLVRTRNFPRLELK